MAATLTQLRQTALECWSSEMFRDGPKGKAFKVGDSVSWSSEAGPVSGRIIFTPRT